SSARPHGPSPIRQGSATPPSRTAPRQACRVRTGADVRAASARSCRTQTSRARDQEWRRLLPSSMSDRTSPDSISPDPQPVKAEGDAGGWLFRHRTALPLPIAAAILAIPAGTDVGGTTLPAAGVAVTVLGEAIRLWGVRHIGAISRTRSERLGPLVDSGPFGYVRNPLYIGNILLWVGFALTARLWWLAPIA